MVGHYHNGMESPDDEGHREDPSREPITCSCIGDWVIVPLNCATHSVETVLPDGKLLASVRRGEISSTPGSTDSRPCSRTLIFPGSRVSA